MYTKKMTGKFFSRILAVSMLITLVSLNSQAQNKPAEPWKESQLMPPSELAAAINSGKGVPMILSIGPSAIIKGSVDIGPTRDNESLEKLKTTLSGLPRNAGIVIYCGCCPFGNCPNVRPAFDLLNKMKFTNHRLLNLATNIRVDWISKGYPVQE